MFAMSRFAVKYRAFAIRQSVLLISLVVSRITMEATVLLSLLLALPSSSLVGLRKVNIGVFSENG